MNAIVDIVKPRINRIVINILNILALILTVSVFAGIGNMLFSIPAAGIIIIISLVILDKLSYSKKIGQVILSDLQTEIVQPDKSEIINNKDLTKVSLKAGIESPFGNRTLSSSPTLILTLHHRNGEAIKLHLSNSDNNFIAIDKYLETLNRQRITVKI